ncbi:MAG TPA: MBL fold metallo-hydrolase [Gammaproteobacteria bacterium]|nr:MBL fold metallo-hydrolase [Gammaproteobacteria bacterium]
MATRFIQSRQEKFYFINHEGKRKFFKLIFGDEIKTSTASPPSGAGWSSIRYRGRNGEIKEPELTKDRSLEMYFLDVGQGDAAFVVTPNKTKILVDGGVKDRALGFLIWKYQLDKPNSNLTIDHLFLSHADEDHVSGLVPLLNHPKITVINIWHNGIAVYKEPPFNQPLGQVVNGKLRTWHSVLADLEPAKLSKGFEKWITAVTDSGANYNALDSSDETVDIGDPDIRLEIVSPILEDDNTFKWFSSKSKTINGHSLTFRIIYGHVRTFFSGDLNTKGSKHILKQPNMALKLNSHIFKSPHHGSHDYYQPLLEAISPMISVVSSGDSPDHGHPRASFLGGLGLAGRGDSPLVFSTEIAATFVDDSDVAVDENEPTTLGDLDFSSSTANKEARRRFKKVLSGIINVRTNGQHIYSARRVRASYQWELYGPIEPES